MGREIQLGNSAIDQFPVFEPDGYTKKTGETSFSTTIWKDGIVSSVTATVAEIGTSGEYKVEFTPDATGFWIFEVLINYNNQIYFGEYTVVTSDTRPVGTPFDPTGGRP